MRRLTEFITLLFTQPLEEELQFEIYFEICYKPTLFTAHLIWFAIFSKLFIFLATKIQTKNRILNSINTFDAKFLNYTNEDFKYNSLTFLDIGIYLNPVRPIYFYPLAADCHIKCDIYFGNFGRLKVAEHKTTIYDLMPNLILLLVSLTICYLNDRKVVEINICFLKF